METVGILGLLGICAWEDIRSRQMHVVTMLGFAVLGVICHLCFQRVALEDMIGGMAVGMVLFAVSLLSDERIGKGDALLVLVTGIYLGFWGNLIVLWGGATIAAIAAFFLVFLRGRSRNYQLPFAPCLFVSYLLYLLLGVGA